jgi:uncharacterized protein YndB with AHSA1/START domain
MAIQACPSDVIHASADRIWDALTIPSQLETWVEARVLDGRSGSLVAGDHLVLAAGPGGMFKIYFDVIEAERPTALTLDIGLPLGVRNHEVIRIAPVAGACRVTFN